MKREDAKQNLITIGIESPTEEQITNYLNQVNGESKQYKDKAELYKKNADDATKAATEAKSQLDDLQSANLSDIEKANKERDEAFSRIADLEAKIKRADTLKSLADKGIVGEDAEQLIGEDGAINFDILGKILTDREQAAAAAKEQEIAGQTTNPNGGKKSEDTDTQTLADKLASNLIEKSKGKQDILSHYVS